MKYKHFSFLTMLLLTALSCNISAGGQAAAPSPAAASTSTNISPTATFTDIPATETLPPSPTFTPPPTDTPTATPYPVVENLKAQVTAGLLSCRYGPGAEYLYLYALKAGANIKLIGRTDANNWVWVDGQNKCWVNVKFLAVDGDWTMLPVVYPGIADQLPVSPYYPGPSWANAERDGNNVQVYWEPVPISPGKYESETMHQYLVEVWRCEGGEIIFETLGTNLPYITVENDQPGCSTLSHGYVYVQEKHGYGGPIEIPWPQPASP